MHCFYAGTELFAPVCETGYAEIALASLRNFQWQDLFVRAMAFHAKANIHPGCQGTNSLSYVEK